MRGHSSECRKNLPAHTVLLPHKRPRNRPLTFGTRERILLERTTCADFPATTRQQTTVCRLAILAGDPRPRRRSIRECSGPVSLDREGTSDNAVPVVCSSFG